MLMLGSKEVDTINNTYDTYKDLQFSKKERGEWFLQGMQSANGLKA